MIICIGLFEDSDDDEALNDDSDASDDTGAETKSFPCSQR